MFGECLRQVEHIRGRGTHIFHKGQLSHGGDRKTLGVMFVLLDL
jgi:hypothetical protein